MLMHVILMNFPDPADALEAERRAMTLEEIDVVREVRAGRNVVASDRNYDFGLVVAIDSADALDEYKQHPVHVEVAAFLRDRRSASVACDFVVDR